MVIEKPKLFSDRRDFLIFAFVILALMLGRLFFSYQAYTAFIAKPFYYTTAKVLNVYPKERKGRQYTVLKLLSEEGLHFFTSTPDQKHWMGKKLRLEIYPSAHIHFFGYLGSFYVKSRIKKILPSSPEPKDLLMQRIASQHAHPMMQSFYQAIFFASPLSKALREKISLLGVSHLVALSGFHLGILWSLVYGVLLLLYRPLQLRYFPYRYSLLDMGLVTILCLGIYLWFVDFPPSLMRSYAMVLVGWIVILVGMDLMSFAFLATVGLTLLALFPALLVSLGFWLSMAGVFYIFLLLQYTKGVHKGIISLLVIPVGIFVLMLPVVHTVFGLTTPYQLLSPLLSLLFIPFYPLVIVLHLLGSGNLLDGSLLWLFGFTGEYSDRILPLWAASVYMGLSVVAIWSRGAFGLLLGVALCYGAYLFLW